MSIVLPWPTWDNTFQIISPCHSAIPGLLCQFHPCNDERFNIILQKKKRRLKNFNQNSLTLNEKGGSFLWRVLKKKEAQASTFLVPNWRRRCPHRPKAAAAPWQSSVLQVFLPDGWLNMIYGKPLPLARIYFITTLKNVQNRQIYSFLNFPR